MKYIQKLSGSIKRFENDLLFGSLKMSIKHNPSHKQIQVNLMCITDLKNDFDNQMLREIILISLCL